MFNLVIVKIHSAGYPNGFINLWILGVKYKNEKRYKIIPYPLNNKTQLKIMPKVKRDPIQEHLVVPDTNILFDGDKKYPVSPDFDAFWNKHLPQIPLELIVPEVVIGELQFQQTTSAIKLASTIRNQTQDLLGVTQFKYRSVLDDTKIKEQISNKLKKWNKQPRGKPRGIRKA